MRISFFCHLSLSLSLYLLSHALASLGDEVDVLLRSCLASLLPGSLSAAVVFVAVRCGFRYIGEHPNYLLRVGRLVLGLLDLSRLLRAAGFCCTRAHLLVTRPFGWHRSFLLGKGGGGRLPLFSTFPSLSLSCCEPWCEVRINYPRPLRL